MKRALAAMLLCLASAASFAQQHPNQAKGFEPGKVYQFEGIDNVNAFNGNLIITIPITPTFHINGALSLGLKLVYNGNVWDYTSDGSHLVALPNRRSNAGIGWVASFGRLIAPDDPSNNLVPSPYKAYLFETPDGADHKFTSEYSFPAGTVVNSESSVYPYSGAPDGAYLRMKLVTSGLDSGKRVVQMADGTKQTYQNHGGSGREKWLLDKIEDAFGNRVDVTYDSTKEIMTLTDASNTLRWMRLTFDPNRSAYLEHVLTKVEVPTFGGGPVATYDFHYADIQVELPAADQSDPNNPDPDPITVPVLQSVSLPGPDGPPSNRDTYSMTYYDASAVNSSNSHATGSIKSLTLPTMGRIEYEWAVIAYPRSSGHLARMPSEDPYPEIQKHAESIGVSTRTIYDRGSSTAKAVWTYEHRLSAKQTCWYTPQDPWHNTPIDNGEPRQKVSLIRSPDGLTTVSYFSVYTQIDCDEIETVWKHEEYGKPLTHYFTQGSSSDPYGVVNRSIETYKGTVNLQTATASNFWDPILDHTTAIPLKSRYIAYHDPANEQAEAAIRNYLFQGYDSTCTSGYTCYQEELRFGFDINGHYSQSSIGGTLPNTVFRTAITNYLTRLPSTSDPWILGLTTETCQRDEASPRKTAISCSTLLTGLQPGEAAPHSRFCYDTNTGFLQRKWTLLGKDPSPNDVVGVWTPALAGTGNIKDERWYGGDTAPLTGVTASTDVCANLTFPTAAYGTDFTYEAGAVKTAKPVATALDSYKTGTVTFKTVDNTIDAYTGKIVTSADTAEIRTQFDYDEAGRLKETKTIDAGGATVSDRNRYTYQTATSSAAAYVTAEQLPAASTTAITSSTYRFDGFGRVEFEERRMPQSVTSIRKTIYDGMGRKTQVSEAETTPSHFTTFTYDEFGRTLTVAAPDSSQTTFTYAGDRTKRRTASIVTPFGDTPVTTQEAYDPLGRLIAVSEGITPSMSTGEVTASYAYDGADRLIGVTMNAPFSSVVQRRSFLYDNRGFLLREEHPESGVTSYGLFDPRGHVGQKNQGTAGTPYDLNFYYDFAERLVRVDARNPNYLPGNGAPYAQEFRPLKTFAYGTDNYTSVADPDRPNQTFTNYAKGKLVTATRFNYFARSPRADFAIPSFAAFKVEETYSYLDAAGRRTNRTTAIGRDNAGDWNYQPFQSFRQRVDYDEASRVQTVNYPHCTFCGGPSATGRNVSVMRDNGLVRQIPGYLTDVTFWESGMTKTVTHGNSLVDTYNIDTNNRMARPLSIQFGDFADCVPPAIVSTSQTSTTISVTATGTATLEYQWYMFDPGTNQMQRLDTETSSSITPTVTQTTNYLVRVKNGCRSIDSQIFTFTVNTCKDPAVDAEPVSETIPSGQSRVLSVRASGSSTIGYQWYRGNLGDTSNPLGTAASQSTGAVAATTSYWVKVSNTCGTATASASATLTVPLPTPAALTATRSSSTQISLSWGASSGASSYSIERRSDGGAFAVINEVSAPTTTYVDGSRVAGKTYIYRVRALDATGGSVSPYSNVEFATMMTFTPVVAGSAMSVAVHNELLTGLNALRGASGWSPITWADLMSIRYSTPAVGGVLISEQVTFLRARVNEALSAMGVPTAPYTDAEPKNGVIRALHIQELQQRMQ